MQFKNIIIGGLGLIGGSMAAALRKKQVDLHITGIDDKSVLEKALSLNLIDQGIEKNNLTDMLKKNDLVILATPVNDIIHLLKTLPAYLKPNTLIIDLGSTKEKVVNAARTHLPKDIFFIGGHPMAGSEKSGLENHDPDLFENTTFLLSKTSEQPPEDIIRALSKLIHSIGAKPEFISARKHDEFAAAVSHLPQILSIALMNCFSKKNTNSEHRKFAATSLRDMTRIAESPYTIWADIIQTNRENIVKSIEDFQRQLTIIKKEIEKEKSLEHFFQNATDARRQMFH